MSTVDSLTPPDPPPGDRPPARGPRRRRLLAVIRGLPRRRLVAISIGLCLAVVLATGYLILNWPGVTGAPLVIDKPNTIVAGQTITRPIEIAADNVTLRRLTVRAGGAAAIRVRTGVTGTVIEDTEIHCTTRKTDGIVPGGYSALRVKTFGCRRSFAHSPTAPATIVDCEQDGRPYAPGSTATPDPGHPSSEAPPASATAPTPLSYWPGPATTGVPPGTALKESGSLNLRTDGEIVTGLNITGCVNVYARNVRITKSKINCSSPTFAIRTLESTVNLVVEDVEINSSNRNSAAVCCGNYTLRRLNIHHMIDGPRLGDRSTVVDSWIHDLFRTPVSHNDTLQTTAGSDMVVRHNRLDAYKPSTKDPMNACLMIGSTTGPTVRNLLVEDNYCAGGNFSIGIRPDLVASNIVIRNNTFGRDCRYGVVSRASYPGISWDRSSNVWFDTGRPVPTP
jgi:hypothetical protein